MTDSRAPQNQMQQAYLILCDMICDTTNENEIPDASIRLINDRLSNVLFNRLRDNDDDSLLQLAASLANTVAAANWMHVAYIPERDALTVVPLTPNEAESRNDV